MLTKGMSVANLKDIYMTNEDFPSTFEQEEVEQETIPYLSMPSRAWLAIISSLRSKTT